MTSTTMSIKERVASGADWLDKVHPKWLDEVDLDLFDIRSTCNCVIGQVVCNYDETLGFASAVVGDDWGPTADEIRAALPKGTKRLVMSSDQAEDRGFEAKDSTDGRITQDYDHLQAEWKKVIGARRKARQLVSA